MASLTQAPPPVPDFAGQVDPNAFKINNLAGLQQEGKDINTATNAVHHDWSAVNSFLDLAGTQAANYMHNAATGDNVTAGQETALHQQDLSAGANAASPASLGQAMMKLSKGGAAQAGEVGSAQGAGQMQMAQKGMAEQQQIVAQRAAMMQSELQLQAQKFAVNNSVAQVQQGLTLAQTHLSNMYNNAVASATNATQYAQITADMQTFTQVMGYVQAGLGAASQVTAAGAQYIKANPNSTLAMAVNPNNVWSSSAGYSSGQYASPDAGSVQGNGTYGGATGVMGVSDYNAGDAGSNIG